jgi:hypothetical protein
MGQRRTSGFALVAVTASLVLVGLPASPAAAADVAQSKVVAANPTDWTPDVLDGEVHSITQVGSLMIAGGLFSQVRAPGAAAITGRSNVVAFDATTGVINASFAPQVDGEVDAVVPSADGTQVYLAGAFNNVGGVRRPSLALVNVADGSLVEAFKPPVFDGVINDAALVSNELWVVGNFTFPNTVVATIDPTTGSYDGFAPLTFAGAHTPGSHTSGRSIDISPEGTRAVIGGNFATIDGLDREQLVMLDLTGPKAAVLSTWQTNDFKTACAPQFDSAVHDVEFSTDGAYFVVGTSGGGTPDHPSLCDAVSRWETGASGSDLHPTWVDSTGGDTVTGTAVTGAAVYAGGHFRWFNNPYSTNAPGPGAVPRSGLVALDPATGLPLRWNPGRDRGVGVFDFFATSTGLWVGSDTDQVGGEQHGRIALFPVAGGDAVPRPSSGALPTRVYRVGQGPATTARALYRVNAGGPPVLATDGGPAWAGDQGVSLRHNAGTVPETWNPVQVVDSSVPTSTPPAVFSDDLTTLGQAPDMHWTFPVAAGTPVSVRLYFAEQNGAFSAPGKRIFNVDVEGRRMLVNFDIMWGGRLQDRHHAQCRRCQRRHDQHRSAARRSRDPIDRRGRDRADLRRRHHGGRKRRRRWSQLRRDGGRSRRHGADRRSGVEPEPGRVHALRHRLHGLV